MCSNSFHQFSLCEHLAGFGLSLKLNLTCRLWKSWWILITLFIICGVHLLLLAVVSIHSGKLSPWFQWICVQSGKQRHMKALGLLENTSQEMKGQHLGVWEACKHVWGHQWWESSWKSGDIARQEMEEVIMTKKKNKAWVKCFCPCVLPMLWHSQHLSPCVILSRHCLFYQILLEGKDCILFVFENPACITTPVP